MGSNTVYTGKHMWCVFLHTSMLDVFFLLILQCFLLGCAK